MSDRPLFGTLVDLPNVESKVNVPQVKTVSDKQVEFFCGSRVIKDRSRIGLSKK